ncbi:MAG: hypothetical protein ACP5I2_01990 [Fervidicoccaceae archaeon]
MPPELGARGLALLMIISTCGVTVSVWLIIASSYAEGLLKVAEALAGMLGGIISMHVLVAAIFTAFNERG